MSEILKKKAGKKAIKKVCVIGAGVMGQAIAAHMVNAGVDCTLLDIASDKKDRNQIVKDAIKKIKLSKPSLLFSSNYLNRIKIGNIDDDLSVVRNCDLVIEAIVEKIDIKQSLFNKLHNYLAEDTIVASNTSGLLIEEMIKGLKPDFAQRFLVMHFFNPVRYLHLLEIVPSSKTLPKYIEMMTSFGEERLGKGVVVGKDTVNFVANRIGVYGMMESINSVITDGYTVEEVDAIFGPALGRPKSAVFRTADIVGLDTFIHVAQNCFDNLPNDECHNTFQIPAFLQEMVKKGWLGQKSGQGFYKKEGKNIFVLDPSTLTYHEKSKVRFESIGASKMLPSLQEKIASIAYADDKAGKLVFNLLAKTCIYSANRLGEISDSIVDIDNAMKWGFGWEMGPFETWDALGLKKSIERMKKEGLEVPSWVINMVESGQESFYTGNHVYSQTNKSLKKIIRSHREYKLTIMKQESSNLVEDAEAYSLIDGQNGSLIVEFHSKMNAIDQEILTGINNGIDRCEAGEFTSLVLANEGVNFSVGANLLLLYMAASQGMFKDIEKIVTMFQDTSKRLRYCSIPTVSAPFQLTLGGGCELSLWCDAIHASAESYIGLVEVGVGLLPGGGGNVEMVARALHNVVNTPTQVIDPFLMNALETVAMAKVATSAVEAKEYKFLRQSDTICMNKRYLIHDACTKAASIADIGYIPSMPRKFRLPGKNSLATFNMGLRSYLDGGFISEHDYKIAMKVGSVMTGGDTNSYQEISEDRLFELEREAFLSLCGEEKTMARIAYMLEHNKPLRN